LQSPGISAGSFRITEDGSRVVFNGSDERGIGLYAARIARGAGAVRIDEQSPGVYAYASPFSIDPQGNHVVYRSGANLYGARIDGERASVELNGALVLGAVTEDVNKSSFSPDGRWCVFQIH